MAEEIAALLDGLEDPVAVSRGAFDFTRGRLAGVEVLLAQCGIGKVNAAALTQLLLLEGVSAVIFTGVAGAVDARLEVGDIVVSTDALQHDLDVTALGYDLGRVPGESLSWPADPRLRRAALEAATELSEVRNVLEGRVVSGDQFIASPTRVAELRERFGAACAEMEGAAVAQLCAKAGVPFVIVRSISDTADHGAEVDFRAFTRLAAERAKRVVRGVLARLG